MLLDDRGKRVRGFCNECGGYVYGSRTLLCKSCDNIRRAIASADDSEARRQRILEGKLRWHYNNHERSLANSKRWKETNRDKVDEYNNTHKDERRGYVEARRARKARVKNEVTGAVWKQLIELYEHKCVYCMNVFDKLEQDHVVPLSRGGQHTFDNVVPACLPCNRRKSTNKADIWHPMFYIIQNSRKSS